MECGFYKLNEILELVPHIVEILDGTSDVY